jgi:hypothetical protein
VKGTPPASSSQVHPNKKSRGSLDRNSSKMLAPTSLQF